MGEVEQFKKKGTKLWLSDKGTPLWVKDHISGAGECLNRQFQKPEDAYSEMFKSGYIRVQLDRYDCFFNFDFKRPNAAQLEWLQRFCAMNQYVLQNGDTCREIDQESFMSNEGNRDFVAAIEGADCPSSSEN